MVEELYPADLIFVRSAGWFGRAIRWATRAKGEAPTYCNHIAGIGTRANVVEALTSVVETSIDDWIPKHNNFVVKRRNGLTFEQRARIAAEAEQSIGFPYGWLKIFVGHFPDALLGKIAGKNVFFFRRIIGLKRFPICSFLWSMGYATYRILFGCRPRAAEPDGMDDFTNISPVWHAVMKYENGERVKVKT